MALRGHIWILVTLLLIIFGLNLVFITMIGLAVENDKGRWTKKIDMVIPKGLHAAAVVNGKIYIIGGHDVGVNPTSAVEEYDPIKEEWKKKTAMPTSRRELSASVVSGKIYAIGGCFDENKPYSTVEIYDPATDTWTRAGDFRAVRRIMLVK